MKIIVFQFQLQAHLGPNGDIQFKVKYLKHSEAYVHQCTWSSFVQLMA